MLEITVGESGFSSPLLACIWYSISPHVPNVLWKHIRFDGLPQTDATEVVANLLMLPFQIVTVHPLLPTALQIGLRHQLAVYDSLYIALALKVNCPLITVDTRQSNAAAASGVILKAITDFSLA